MTTVLVGLHRGHPVGGRVRRGDGANGDEIVYLVTSIAPSLVLLDMKVADGEGLSVFRCIADISPVPVIIVTAGDDELDAVLALEAGAADHVTKPLRSRELTARIRAVLRRVGRPSPRPRRTGAARGLHLGPVQVDLSLREAVVRGRPVDLSARSSIYWLCSSPSRDTLSVVPSAWTASGGTERRATAVPSTPT